jgi:hypothetical protein
MRVLIVAALDTSALCRLPRLFHEAGYEVDLMAPAGLTAARSRYVRKSLQPAALGALPGHYDRIVLADEPAAQVLVKPPVEFLLSALETGIPMPPCEICDSPEAALDAAQIMGFPVLVQPGGPVATARDLSAMDLRPPVVVMRSHGDPGSIAVLYEKGEVLCWFGYLNRGECIQIFRHSGLPDVVAKTGRLLGFSGLASIQFEFDRDRDEVLLTAFHPWPDPCCDLGPHAGVDFARALRSTSAPQTPTGPAGKRIALFPEALADPSSWKQAPWTDPRLLLAELLNYRRLSASRSSSVRGQSEPSSRESPRSASTLPPV